jgi:DNA-binding PucR family transcriptional regulator
LKRQCAPLASGVASRGFTVGIGGWHPGLAGIPQSYAEARDAVEIANRTGVTGRAVAFQDVLIEHVLRSTPHSDRLLADALGPLREYDQARGADLVNTLRAYIEAGYNLTRSAHALFVHPNTVVYRLRRIRELTGRDPGNPDDLLLLTLGLRIADLGEAPLTAGS